MLSRIKQAAQSSNLSKNGYYNVAKVMESNENQNCCTIQTKDYSGKTITVKDVQIQNALPGFISYFPQKNDLVIVFSYGNAHIITSPYFKTTNDSSVHYKVKNNTMPICEYGIVEGNIL